MTFDTFLTVTLKILGIIALVVFLFGALGDHAGLLR